MGSPKGSPVTTLDTWRARGAPCHHSLCPQCPAGRGPCGCGVPAPSSSSSSPVWASSVGTGTRRGRGDPRAQPLPTRCPLGVPECHIPGVPRVRVSWSGGGGVPRCCVTLSLGRGSPWCPSDPRVGCSGWGVPSVPGIPGCHIPCVPCVVRGGWWSPVSSGPVSLIWGASRGGGVPGWGFPPCPPSRTAMDKGPQGAATAEGPENWGPPGAPQPGPACAALPAGAGHPRDKGHPRGGHPWDKGHPKGGHPRGHPSGRVGKEVMLGGAPAAEGASVQGWHSSTPRGHRKGARPWGSLCGG